jgi:hypothetical protein
MLAQPLDVASAADGSLIVADTANHVIRRVDSTGRIATIAGAGVPGAAAERTRAESARFDEPSAVAGDRDGTVLVADTGNDALRRIDLKGMVTTIARGLSAPTDVVVIGAGQYLVADTGHDRVALISADGAITSIAGTGERGFSGDGGPASQARLDGPTQLSPSADGLLIADTGNRVIRRVGLDGLISTVAGRSPGAPPGTSPVTRLGLVRPRGVATTRDGGFVIGDVGRVWAVSSDGAVRPLAGTGQPGFTGDRGRALALRLDHPGQILGGSDGAIVIADTDNDRVRRVSQAGGTETVAGSGEPDIVLAPPEPAPLRDCRPNRGCASSVLPRCAYFARGYNYLKIRPYTRRVIRSVSRPVVIRFGTSVDARVTSFAWRRGARYGRRTVRVSAGPGTIRLRGSLLPGRYFAVIEGRDKQGLYRCDSRRLRIR